MDKVPEIVEAIYKAEDAKIRGLTRLRPVQYEDSAGVTSCFVFRGSPAELSSSAFVQLSDFTATLNDRIRKQIIPELPAWRYLTHVPHVTAAAVIDPLQQHRIPPEPAESLLWAALVKSFAVLAGSFAAFEISFFRLFIAGNGTVVLVGWPSTEVVGQFKEIAFHVFKSERWWKAKLADELEVLDHSLAPVIGHFERADPTKENVQSSGSDYDFPFERVQDMLGSIGPVTRKINVEEIWLVLYENRLINPEGHVRRIERLPLQLMRGKQARGSA